MNRDPFFKRRTTRGVVAAAGVLAAGATLAGCAAGAGMGGDTRDDGPHKPVTVATCSPNNAGQEATVMPYFLNQMGANYKVAIADANGKVLRSYDIASTYPYHRTENFNSKGEYIAEVSTEGFNGSTHYIGNSGSEDQDIKWSGIVKPQYVTEKTINGTTVQHTPFGWNETYFEDLVCPGTGSILYQPDGTTQSN